jgi:hypothetical protein
MKIIKIIEGVYGYRSKDGKGAIQPKKRGDEPFEVSESEAARLVEGGIAEYVDEVAESEDDSGGEGSGDSQPNAKPNKPVKSDKSKKSDV